MYDGSYCQETKEKRSWHLSVKTTWDEAAAVHESPGADYGSGGLQRISIWAEERRLKPFQ